RLVLWFAFFFPSRRRHTRFSRDWSSDVCSSDLLNLGVGTGGFQILAQLLDLVIRVEGAQQVADAFRPHQRLEVVAELFDARQVRSEERRVGKAGRSR